MIPASDLWMLGLRPLRGGGDDCNNPAREVAMAAYDTNPGRTGKYVVASRGGQWRVTYEEAGIGEFGERADATAFACDLARLQAEGGRATIVVVHAAVQEMHCFTPSRSASAAAFKAPRRNRLRIVGDAG